MSLTTLTDASTIAVDGSQGPSFAVTLGGNHTLGNPTSQIAGQVYVFLISQDATGGRQLRYGNCYCFADGQRPDMTTDANGLDIQMFVSDGTNMNCMGSQSDVEKEVVAPSGLTASTGLAGVINLSWTNNDVTATAVQIWLQDPVFGWQPLTQVAGNATTYQDTESAGSYTYAVSAIRNDASSDMSDPATGDCT